MTASYLIKFPVTRFLVLFTVYFFYGFTGISQHLKSPDILKPLGQPVEITNYTPSSQYTGGTVIIYYSNPSIIPTTVSAVSFGGVQASSFTHDEANKKITAIVAEGASGDVSVTTSQGIMSRPSFVFLSGVPIPPTITSFSPASQIAGDTVTIKGTNFIGVSSVKFGSTNGSTFTVVSDTVIIAVVAPWSASGTISVVTPAGTATIDGFTFTDPRYVYIPDNNFREFLKSKYPACFNTSDWMDTTCAAILSETDLLFPGMNISNIEGVQYFKAVQVLDCSNNSLDHLPALPGSVITFFCSNNQLTALPKLPAGLQELQCTKNLLTVLPELPGSLGTLYCDFNLITSLPSLPNNLTYLNCGSNQLVSLPVLPNSLVNLFCPGNKLASLPSLPGSLEGLGCAFNKLTSLPLLPYRLSMLHCDSNQLSSLPPLPDNLRELFCGCNTNLHCLPRLPYYATLFFDSAANIKCLPNTILYYTSEYSFNGVYTYNPSNLNVSPGADYLSYGNTAALQLAVCNETSNPYSCPEYTGVQNIYVCPPAINAIIVSAVTGSTYQWQIDTCSDFGQACFQDIHDNGSIITGTNTATLQLTDMAAYGRKYQFRCMVNNTAPGDIYRINFSAAWLGGTESTAWENSSYWSCGKIPDMNTDVTVKTGTLIINSPNAICRSLTVSPEAIVTVAPGAKLTIIH